MATKQEHHQRTETEDPSPAQEAGTAVVLSDQLCFAVYSLSHAFNRTYKPLLDRIGLTYPQYLVLLALWQHRTMTVRQIGEQLGLDSGTLSPLLKRLDAAGLVSRTRDRKDERQVIVGLTDRGAALQTEAADIHASIGQATGCSLEDARALRERLQSLTERLETFEDRAEPVT